MPDVSQFRVLGDAEPAPAPATAAAPDASKFKVLGDAEKPALSGLERFGHGLADQFVGGSSLLAQNPVDLILGREPPKGSVAQIADEFTKKRAQTYDAARKAAGQSGIDWWRLAGNAANPLNFVVPGFGAAKAAGIGGRIGASALSGATSAALEPVESGDFGTQKAKQIGTGGLVGGISGPLADLAILGGSKVAGFVGQYLAKDFADNQANKVILRRMNQDIKSGAGPTATDALKAVADARAEGQPMTLADVAGPNVKALAGHVARQPGEAQGIARVAMEQRDRDATSRLGNLTNKYLSSGPSAFQTTGALLTARSAAARPLYAQAEALQGVWSPDLQKFLEDPVLRRGMGRGYVLERLDALAEGRPFNPTQMGVDLDAEGNIVLKSVPNLRVLDMGKRGLDAMISDERDPLTGRLTAMGRSLSKVRDSYMGIIDNLDRTGVYKRAREAWAGPSASMDAVRFGRTAFARNPEESAAEFSKMSASDQEFARLGLADIIRERIAKTGFAGNEARAVIQNPWMREQLKPFFRSTDAYDKFVDGVMAEHKMAETNAKLFRNSMTAERMAEDMSPEARALASAAGVAGNLAHGNMIGAVMHAARLKRDLGIRRNPELNEAIAKRLFSQTISPGDAMATALTNPPAPPPIPASIGPYLGAAAGGPLSYLLSR